MKYQKPRAENRPPLHDLGECEERLRFEMLIADLSTKFINLPVCEIDHEIMEAGRMICESLDLDIVALWQFSKGTPDYYTVTHYYSVQEGPQPPGCMKVEDFPWYLQQMLDGRIVIVPSLKALPAEAAHDRETCHQLGIKSNLTLPISVGGESPFGILGFNTTRAERDWPEILVKRLQLVGQIFSNALARKRAEEVIHSSAVRLEASADLAGLGCYEVDFDGCACFIDDRFHEICGIPAGRHASLQPVQRWLENLHPDDRERVLDAREKLHDGRIERLSIEYRYLHPIEGQKWIHHLGRVSARDATGRVVRSFGAAHDITQRKQMERDVQELRDNLTHLTRVNTLGALSGSLAHELNQPLGIILSNAQAAQDLLLQQPPDVAEVQDILVDIVAADRRAGQIIERLRALLKRDPVSAQQLPFNGVIEDVLNLLHADIIGRGVTVISDLSPDLPLIPGDRVQLQQLTLNLILNATEAMAANAPGTRRIHIQTMLHQGRVRTSIRDEGSGLPAEVESLFQSFYTTKPQGLGLGLAICRSIVAAHHGRLWAESHPEGGAVFHFELPVAGVLDKP